MTDPFASLLGANIAFVGSHFAMSHPLRAPLVRMLGEKGFLGVYSIVSLGFFAWIVIAFRQLGPGVPLWNGAAHLPWAVGSVLTIVALALLLGSFRGNPAMPDTPVEKVQQARATGAFAVTRHPMMWGFALWAIAHIIVWPGPRTLVTAGAMGLLALLGAHLQDRKKEALLGAAWQGWEAQTSYWPKWSRLTELGLGLWLAALVVWLGVTWLHVWLADMPAGVWMWVG